jgi:hypothetical protein
MLPRLRVRVCGIRAGGHPAGSRLYLRYPLSYRDVKELLAEGLHAHHVTVWKWVRRYAPELRVAGLKPRPSACLRISDLCKIREAFLNGRIGQISATMCIF